VAFTVLDFHKAYHCSMVLHTHTSSIANSTKISQEKQKVWTEINLPPLSTVRMSLRWFSWNSHLPNKFFVRNSYVEFQNNLTKTVQFLIRGLGHTERRTAWSPYMVFSFFYFTKNIWNGVSQKKT